MTSDRDENPVWTADDFARARPAAEVLPAEFIAAVARSRGRPKGTTRPDSKQQITLRLDRDIIDRFRATGPGWQARMNDALRQTPW